MRRRFSQAESNAGIITNLPTTNVVWSGGRNIRFGLGYVKKTNGKTLLTTIPSGTPIRAMFTFKGHDGTVRTVVFSDAQVFAYTADFTSYDDISPTIPISPLTANDAWQFSLCGGMLVVSNGVDRVMKWENYGGRLETITDAPTVAKTLATVNNRVVYGWVIEGGYEFSGRLRWTKIADPTVATINKEVHGGRSDLMRPSGGMNAHERVKAISSTGRSARVYTERNIWILGPSQAPYVFRADIIAEDISILSTRSVVNVKGIDYVIGTDDLYKVTDVVQPIGLKIKNSIFANINKDAAGTSFSFYKPDTQEVFFCVPTAGATTPNTAFILNLETDNFSVCDVNYLCHAYSWVEDNVTWDSNPFGVWDSVSDSDTWDQTDTGVIPYSIVGNANGEILKLDEGVDDYYAGDTIAIDSYIETGDMILSTDFVSGDGIVKTVSDIYPSLKPQSDKTTLMIEVGVRESLSDNVKWSSKQPYTIGVSRKVSPRSSGKYVRLRFSSGQIGDQWIMDGYSMDYFYRGSR